MKKHIPDSGYDAANRLIYPLFDAASTDEASAVRLGAEAFQARYPETHLFPDPFLGKKQKSLSLPLAELRLVHGGDSFFRELAEAFVAGWRERWGFALSISDANDPVAALASPGPKLFLGGGDLNPRSLEIARKYQLGIFSSEFPGKGGWGLTTYGELESGIPPCFILTCDAESREEALRVVLEQIADSAGRMRWVHQIFPGPELPEEFRDFEIWASEVKIYPPLESLAQWWRSGRPRPYREVFRDFFIQTEFPEGLPSNSQYLDLGVDAIRYYQCSGSEQALDLFREMLWGLWEYLHSENPQIYISDMDFRIGLIGNYWNWIQHHPSITEEEQVAFDQLLLGALRMVRGYFRQMWKDRPGPAHNHQTFKARSLIMGWRYFRERNVPDLSGWKEDADAIFERVDPAAFKFKENAGVYEIFVPEHTLVWLEVTNQSVPAEMKDALAKFALRDWAMRDNFFFPVDYGDCNPHVRPVRPFTVASWLDGSTPEQKSIQSLEASSNGPFPLRLLAAIWGFTGLQQGQRGREFSGEAGWQLIPLDPGFARTYEVTGPPGEHFDKLAWRSGWKPESAYLALEGIGNQSVSHAHNDAGGILRLNLAGRIWLVGNGYGKRAGTISAREAFATRERGPDDHNMLVLRDAGTGKCLLPPVNAQLKDHGDGPLPFAVAEVKDYGGLHWQRILIILPELGLIVCDQIVREEGHENPYELQWNILGSLTPTASGAVLSQNGVDLVWEQFGTSVPKWEESQITVWREFIQSGEYPHTQAMPTHCIQKMTEEADEAFFVNGFWLQDAVRQAAWDKQKKELSLTLTKPLNSVSAKVERPWGEMEVNATDLRILFR